MELITKILDHINYVGAACLFVIGLYTVLTHPNLLKKVIGINIMETSVFLFIVSIAYIADGRSPILSLDSPMSSADVRFVNPLPHALILTGIVVAVSLTAYALTLLIKIHDTYGTLEMDEIMEMRSKQQQ